MKTLNNLFNAIITITLTSITTASAQDMSVVDVRRNITLADDDIIYKDFYINAGEGTSLRKNMVVNVKRKVAVKESSSKTVGDFETIVGQLKVIKIGNKVSVAREFKLVTRDEEPMLEQVGIMSGDRVDLNGSFIDNTKPVYKNKSSENQKPEDSVQTAAATLPATRPATNLTELASTAKPTTEPTTVPTTAATTTTITAQQPATAAQNSANPTTVKPEARNPANTEPTLLQKIIPMPTRL